MLFKSALVCLLFSFALMGNAQNLQVSLLALKESKDFGGRITCIFQDKTGFIWIGKETGLFRYDGNILKVYRNDPKDSFSISSNNILAIKEDNKGNLWIGTKGGGLNHFNRASGRFDHYIHNDLDPQSISFNEVYVIEPDEAGNFWIGTDGGGLNYFNPATGKFINYKKSTGDTIGLQSDKILSIVKSGKGNYWVGTWGGGLNLFNRESKKFTHIGLGTPFAKSNVFSIAEVSKDVLWLTTFNQGLIQYDVKTDRFSTIIDTKSGAIMRQLILGKNGNIWVTSTAGLFHFSSPSLPYQLVPVEGAPNIKDFAFVFEDRADLIWVGLRNGAVGNINSKPKNFTVLPDYTQYKKSSVTAIFLDEASKDIYYSSWKTLIRYNPVTKKHKVWQSPFNLLSAIVDIAGTDSLLCSSSAGIKIFNKKTGIFSKLLFSKESPVNLLNKEIWTVVSFAPLVYWVGASEVAYQIEFDKRNGIWNVLKVYNSGSGESLPASHFVSSFLNDSKGNFWIGTLGGGLNQLKTDADRFAYYMHDIAKPASISDNYIEYLINDSDGHIWAATHAGLNKVDLATSSFKNISIPDGLSSDWISAIAIDAKKRIWVSTQKGISSLSPDLTTIKNYDPEDGLPSASFNARSVAHDEKGNLYFGSAAGLLWFHPDSIKVNPYVPTPVLVDFLVNDKPVTTGNTSVIKQSIELTERIELNSDQSSFSFKMAALSYFNTQKNRIKFKLKGYDKDWRMAGTDQLATYSGISAGSYEFSFMVSNEDGIWNMKEKSVKIIVAGTFWLSTTAFILYFLLVSVITLFFFFGYRKRVAINSIKTDESKPKKSPNHDIIQPAEVKASPAEVQFLQRAILIVEENMADPDFHVKELSAKMFISRPQLYRKISAITGVTITEFIKEIRLKRAAQLILLKPGNISEIAYQVGFNDPKYFSKCFKRQFGVSPANYKAQDERILPQE